MLKSRRGRLLHHGALAKHRVRVVAAFRIVFVHIELGGLGVLYFERAAARVDVTAVEVVLGCFSCVDTVKLYHGLHPIFLEDDYTQNLADWRTDGVQHVARDRVGRI